MSLSQGNEIAFAALVLWLPLTGLAFAVARPPVAGAVALIAAALCLPYGVELIVRGLPELGKDEIGAFSVLFYCLLLCRNRLRAARPGRGFDTLILILVAGAVVTAFTNTDSLTFGETLVPGLTIYDAFSMASRDFLRLGIPFFIGRALFRTTRDLRMLMTAVVVAAVVYSVLVGFEMRMGPRLQHEIYAVHSGIPHHRYGIFRPFVFMGGLSLALFLASATISSVTLARVGLKILGLSSGIIATYLGLLLFLTRSFASIVYASAVVPVVAFLKPRLQMRVAVGLSLFCLAYPMLRSIEIVPVDGMVNAAALIDIGRSESLAFRFENEDMLLGRVRERMLFGWGGWNRSAAFVHGRPESITDGWWIIVLGQRGLVGFLASFGLLTLPVLLAHLRLAAVGPERDQRLVAGFSLVVAISTIDLLPNALWTYFAPVFAGALVGVIQGVRGGQETSARARSRTRGARDAEQERGSGAPAAP